MKNKAFRIVAVALLACVLHTNVKADVGVTVTNSGNTIPHLAGYYSSLTTAINALNTITVISGPVMLTCDASGSEIAPAGGYEISFTAVTTNLNYVVIDGNNSVITASSAQSTGVVNDAIFKIIGSDYVTLKNFVMHENPLNTTTAAATNNMTEWGVALLYASATNGAQNNTIQGNTISLNRAYSNTFGIYSNTRHTAGVVTVVADITAASGSNSNNQVYSNNISNVNFGIAFIGSGTSTYLDNGNDIGGRSLNTGNTISNWGGAAAATGYISNPNASYCILVNQQTGENVANNTITSAAVSGTAVAFRGIVKDYTAIAPIGTFTSNVTNNTITMSSGFLSGVFQCIYNAGMTSLTTATINIENNNIANCALTGVGTTSAFTGILNSSGPGSLSISNNNFYGNSSTGTTGGFTAISNSGAVITSLAMNNNQVGTHDANAITLSAITSGIVYGISTTGGTATCAMSASGNIFKGFVYGNPGTGIFHAINSTATVMSETINNNNFNDLTINTSASTNYGFLISASNATPLVTITGNVVMNQFTNASATGSSQYSFAFYNTGTPIMGSSTISGNVLSNITLRTNATYGAMIYWVVGNIPNSTHNIIIDGNTISNITNLSAGSATQGAGMIGIVAGFGYSNVISNNTIENITANGGNATGIYTNSSLSGYTSTFTIFNNVIHDIKTSSQPVFPYVNVGSATGLQLMAGTSVNNIYKNKIYNILAQVPAGSSGGSAVGILTASSVAALTTNIYNNYIGRIYAPSSILSPSVKGISVNSAVSNTTNIFYNTVYLDGTCNKYSVCFIKNSDKSVVSLRNNIFSNKVQSTGGLQQMVYFFKGIINDASYLTSSNNNLLFCGYPGSLNIIYADGAIDTLTNISQTLSQFKTFAGPVRESLSKTENVPFQNTTAGQDANFLHVTANIATQVESGAVNIATYTDDYDGDIRQGNPGYPGSGSAPDIGADEFGGFSLQGCDGTPSAANIVGAASVCAGSGTTLSLSTSYTTPGFIYQWASSATSGGPYVNLGIEATQETGNLTVTTYYICTILCLNSGGTYTTPEKAVTIKSVPTATATSNSPVCEGSAINLTGQTNGTSFSWTGLLPHCKTQLFRRLLLPVRSEPGPTPSRPH